MDSGGRLDHACYRDLPGTYKYSPMGANKRTEYTGTVYDKETQTKEYK